MDYNPLALNNHAHSLYVDFPVGGGYSDADISKLRYHEEVMADDFVYFLKSILDTYTHL